MASGELSRAAGSRASLPAASGLLGLSTVATRVTTLVVMALLARQAGITAVGFYGLATLSASFAAAALSFGLPTYLTRDVSAGLVSPPEVTRIHCGRLVVLLLAAAVAYPVTGSAVPAPVRVGFLLFFGASLLDQWNETAWVLVRGTRSAWREPLITTSTGLLLLAACAVDAWKSADGLTLGDAAGYVAVTAAARSAAAFGAVGMVRQLGAPGRLAVTVQLRRALPYFASDLLGLFYFRGDVFVLAAFVSTAQLGEYVSAAALTSPAVQVAAAMGTGALAFAARRPPAGGPTGDFPTGGSAGKSSVDDSVRVVRFFRLSGQVAAGLVGMCLPVVVVVLFGAQGHRILGLATILTLFLALRFANFGLSALLLARGRPASRLLVLVLSIGGNVGMNLALDGRFGAYGAAWATVLTELIVAGSLLWFLRIPALGRPVAAAVLQVAAAAAVLGGLLAVLAPARVALLTGGFLLAVAAVDVLLRGRAGSRLQPGSGVPVGKAGQA